MHARYFINVQHAVELIHKELACYKKLVCSPRNFDKSSAAKNCRRYFEIWWQYGGNFCHYKLTL